MRKLINMLSVALCFASVNAFSAVSELSNHAHLAQPTQSKDFYKTQLVNRYVLSDYEDVTYHNLMRSVIRDLGSDKSKRVHLIWKDKTAKKSAVKIRDVLVKKGIDSKRVVLERQHKQAVYPVYVEVARIGAKKTNCRVKTGEDMMSWDGQDSCASKNNHRIQLKY
ncbi:protein RcpB [Pasteurella sp. PK-2025]|uniref:protein RcpB n=1 Tax=Pasteurella sp. PK-2025 TaxID=3413133 RepID=UPI003C71F621